VRLVTLFEPVSESLAAACPDPQIKPLAVAVPSVFTVGQLEVADAPLGA
jgi:hypothetical protein